MTQMLKHKVDGELFVWTAALAKLDELETVEIDDTPAEVLPNAVPEYLKAKTPKSKKVVLEADED